MKPSERIDELAEIYQNGPDIGLDSRVMAYISAICDYLDEALQGKEAPMGISQWLEHGKRYGYDQYQPSEPKSEEKRVWYGDPEEATDDEKWKNSQPSELKIEHCSWDVECGKDNYFCSSHRQPQPKSIEETAKKIIAENKPLLESLRKHDTGEETIETGHITVPQPKSEEEEIWLPTRKNENSMENTYVKVKVKKCQPQPKSEHPFCVVHKSTTCEVQPQPEEWETTLEQNLYPYVTHGKGYELKEFIRILLQAAEKKGREEERERARRICEKAMSDHINHYLPNDDNCLDRIQTIQHIIKQLQSLQD